MDFKYIAIICSCLLLVFLFYKEIKRADKNRLFWRILANLMAIACFTLIIIPLKYNSTVRKDISEVTILTEGAVPDSVSKLTGKIYQLSSARLGNTNLPVISDLSYFLAENAGIEKIQVYGYGFSDEELKSLKNYKIIFHPSPAPDGIVSVNWTKEIKATGQLSVQGTYQNDRKTPVKLVLKGFGKTIDSVLIEARLQKQFSFQTQPKQLGKAVYELIAFNGKDTLSSSPVPFTVMPKNNMSVLVLASSPDFEYKFLKKWLYDKGYAVAFRSQISKDKFSTDFLNTDSININQMTPSILKKIDVLIIDEEELAVIKPSELLTIENAVNSGMGLIIRISGEKTSTPLSVMFSRFEIPSDKLKPLTLLGKDESYQFSPLITEHSLFLKLNAKDRPVITDFTGRIIVSSNIKGAGRVIASTLSETFNWILSGKINDYTKYWSMVISKASKKQSETQTINLSPQFPVIHQRMEVIADLQEAGKMPSLKAERVELAPLQNMELPFEWNTSLWPVKSGWNNLNINNKQESFYVYENKDWSALKSRQKSNLNKQYARLHSFQSKKATESDTKIQNTVSVWWFFTGFILAFAFLWYESRILSTGSEFETKML